MYILRGGFVKGKRCDLVARKDELVACYEYKRRWKAWIINVEDACLSAGQVVTLPEPLNLQEQKERMKQYKSWINEGITTIVVPFIVPFSHQLRPELTQMRNLFIDCPLDYFFLPVVKITCVTPTFIRTLRQENITGVILNPPLEDLPHHAARELLGPHGPAAFVNGETLNSQQKKALQDSSFEEFTFHALPAAGEIWPLDLLKVVGMYPKKGSLKIRGDLDYLIYYPSPGSSADEAGSEIKAPDVAVRRGQILKAGEQLFIHPGSGRECKPLSTKRFHSIKQTNETRY
ncbi:hypothetical protein [Salsuginibacillus kocurii]|uniref:hypothetical protein n=1 Tax=Salsuginibacillus kocurii TaxID=427078 RepID=UPI000371F9A5|nr:hypothetical protein [Salsuginibacillus kocurii]